MDAIAMLTADHKAVKVLFKQFERLCKADGTDDDKAAVVRKICAELTVHAQVEEEVFYPAVRVAIDDDPLLDEAEVEHATAKDLIAQLREMSPGDELYDAKVTVLGEYIDHHVEEEVGEMFPKARSADVDTAALGAEMAARKQELMSENESEDDAPGGMPAVKETNGSKRAPKSTR